MSSGINSSIASVANQSVNPSSLQNELKRADYDAWRGVLVRYQMRKL